MSLHTPVCELLGIQYPVLLGGMAGGTNAELVSAVSEGGGLGILGVTGLTAADVSAASARIRELTSRPFGLNLLLFRSEESVLDAMLAAHPSVMSFAWPTVDQHLGEIFARARQGGATVIHMVSNVEDATRAAEAGADVIVAQGTEGGGHVGMMSTMVLVPQVVTAVKPVPVLAAGGIADGRGLAAALCLGAQGILAGTRFLATPEAPLHPNFKQAILDSDGHDTDLTEIPDLIAGRAWPGALSRVRRNQLISRWAGREWEVRLRQPTLLAHTMSARESGDVDNAVLFIGQDAGLISSIEPASLVVEKMAQEAEEILNALRGDSPLRQLTRRE